MKHIKILMLFCAFAVMFAAPASAAVTTVNTAEELKAAINATDTASSDIKLGATISFDTRLDITKDLSIDLNSFDLKAEGVMAFLVKSGDVVFTGNGTISVTSKDSTEPNGIQVGTVADDFANTRAKLTIGEGVTVTNTDNYGIVVAGKNQKGIVLVLDGKVSVAGENVALGNNGRADLASTDITINGTVEALEGFALYHPGAGNLTINGTVIGGAAGIEAKSGSADIGVNIGKNAKITSTSKTLYHKKYSNGPSTTGFAISAVQNKDYKGNVKINIGSGALINGYVVALSDDVFKFSPATVSMEVNVASIDAGTATLSYDTYPGAIKITGGVFSKRPYKVTDTSKSYVSGDYSIIPLSNDTYKYGVVAAAKIAKPTLSIDVNGKVSTDYTAVYSKDQELVLTALPTPADIASIDIAYTYKWTKSEDKTVSADTKVFTLSGDVADSGTYKCVIEVSMDGKVLGSADATVKVTITEEESETKEITVKISADKTSMAVGETATFKITTVSPDLTGAVYTWFKGTASTDKTSSTDNFVVSSDEAGSFDVYVLVTSGDYIGSSDKVTITVTEAEAEEDEKATITIAPKSGTSATLPDGTVGTEYTATLSDYFTVTTSPDSKAVYTWSATDLPDGLSVSAGAITGKPTASADAATVTVKVTLSDDTTVSADATATITIKASSGGSDTPKEGATAEEAKAEARKEIDSLLATSSDATVADLLTSATFVANVTKNVSSGTLDMGVLNGFTTLKNLSQLLATLASNGTSVTALNFATITTVTAIAAGDLDGVKVTTMDFSANTSVTTASFKGATITGTLNLSGAVHKVATVDLAGATVDTVDMKSSGVTSATLDASSDVKKIDANGSDLATIELAGNDNIQELDVGGTSVTDLDAAGCEGLTTLGAEGGTGTGDGSLQNLDVTGCTSLTSLTVTNNKLLGIAADSTTKRPTTFSARGQGRSAPSSFTFSRTFNLISLLRSILGSTPTFTITSTTVTSIVGGTNNTGTITDSGDITFSSMPTQLKYDYNPTFAAASGTEFVAAAEDGMDVTISANAGEEEEATLPSSSGGGCDAGFGFGALAALMAVFALKKRR